MKAKYLDYAKVQTKPSTRTTLIEIVDSIISLLLIAAMIVLGSGILYLIK